MSKTARWTLVLARLAFFGAALAVMVLANLPDPPQFLTEFSDNKQHTLAFVVLAGLARFAWPGAAWWAIMLSLAAFGALIEAVQFAAGLGRDASLADWLVDVAAIAATLILLGAVGRLRSRGW